MNTILDMPLRQVLRNVACYIGIGIVFWLPVIAELLRAGR